MKIYIVTPGHFYEGFNSRVRGEGRWLVHMAGVLVNQGHEVCIVSTDQLRPYQDNGVWFSSIYNKNEPDCDLMISMDPWMDVPHLHKTEWGQMLEEYNPQKRVLALFFPTADEVYDYLPVIHPWNYQQVRDGKAHFLPTITHEVPKPPGFDRNRVYWYSKRPNEENTYLLGSILGAHAIIVGREAEGFFVDGAWIQQGEYRNCDPQKEAAIKSLYQQILDTGRVDSLGTWAPYDHARNMMIGSKLLLGIEHPVAAPSMAEAAATGSFPVLFQSQTTVPPYDVIDLPCIPMDADDSQIREFILKAWDDREFFESTVLACQAAVEDHRQSRAAVRIQKFIEEL